MSAQPVIQFDCQLARPAFLFDVAFEAGPGVTALFGPSGSGKSTAIRLLAGLERPDTGRIIVEGETLLDTKAGRVVAPHRRRIGLVFQDALLLPHLSVSTNLTYGRWFTPQRQRRIAFDPVVDVLGIGHLLDRRPDTLSGGERQRVAIGRALLTSPRLLLMDEPLASLDGARKQEILPFIERMRDEFGIPVIYVSHAVEEVARLADRVIRLENGRVVAAGSPNKALGPLPGLRSNRFEAVSVLSARIKSFDARYGVTVLEHPAGEITVPGRIGAENALVRVLIQATNVTVAIGRLGNISVRTVLTGEVQAVEVDDGPLALITLGLTGGDLLKVYVTRLAADELGLGKGDNVQALIKSVTIDERALAAVRPTA